MKYLFLYLIVLSLVFVFTNAHALLLTTPLDLWESNQLIMDGTIISKTVISSEKLIQYDVKVNQYFKNPQKSTMITIYGPSEEDTDYMYPKYFEIGERVLFYLNKIDGKYKISPYSVKTTKTCNARDFIEISPVLPNERPPISSPAGNEEYFDPCVPSYFPEDPDHVTVVTDNDKMDTDYVKYDFSNKENFALPAFIKKTPLPSDIRQSMLDWCQDSTRSAKNSAQFWDAMPIRILSTTHELQSFQGKTDSFVVHSYAARESCPPDVEMLGTFTLENGDEHKFALSYNGDFFRYQIGDIKCSEGLVLVIKATDGSPACVKPETKQKLIERNWAILSVLMEWNDGEDIKQINKSNQSKVKITVQVGEMTGTNQVFPILITEAISDIADDKVKVWFFQPTVGEIIRDWNIATNRIFEIVDRHGNDAIDRSRLKDTSLWDDVSHTYEITCDNNEKIPAISRTPTVIPIKDGITEAFGRYSNIGIPPNYKANHTLKFASFFDQEIILPNKAIVLSNRSETCSVLYDDYTKAYYDEVVFRFG